jgi:Flp pilus assembly protein TadG
MMTAHKGERGAVLIHVAIATGALVALAALSIDLGVKWVARGQAQNSADAGALAGAVGLALDQPNVLPEAPLAKQSAVSYATANAVWGQAPNVDITTDVKILCPSPTCAEPCPDGSSDTCVRVDVYRNQERANASLPTFFGRVAGVMAQGVKATATAKVLAGNATECLKPWAVPDKWFENYPVPVAPEDWTPDLEFNKYYDKGPNKGAPIPNPDIYIPPTSTSDGSGYTLANDLGTELVLKPGHPNDAIAPGWFFAVDVTDEDHGGRDYRDNIAGCSGAVFSIGEDVSIDMDTENGDMIGPTRMGVDDLIAQDPYATYNPATKQVDGGCASWGACAQSPRIVAIPVFDTGAFADGRQTGKTTLKIVNILGFFIDRMQGNDVHGYLVTAPGLFVAGAGEVPNTAAFTFTIVLVR